MSNLSVEPQTVVKLLRCGLQRNSGHQLTFTDATAQYNYFSGRVLYTYTDFTYVRDNNSVTVGDNLDSIRDCNYLMYQNTGFTNKWFYAFVTDLEYVNENCTRVYFETDSWQTWMYDFDYHRVFVEREHTNDDTVGANTVPESLETGEYVCDMVNRYTGLDNYCYLVLATTDDAGLRGEVNIGGICSTGVLIVCNNYKAVNTALDDYASTGRLDAIYSVYVAPKEFVDFNFSSFDNVPEAQQYSINYDQDHPIYKTFNIAKPTSNESYVPLNKKLLTYPYRYLILSNNNGASNILKYESFSSNNNCTFSIAGIPTIGGSIKITPVSYNEGEQNNSLSAGKFPICNWSGDIYTNWLTQNSVNISTQAFSTAMQGLTGITSIGLSAVTGNPYGIVGGTQQVGSSLSSIGQMVGTNMQHKMEPDSARGNVNIGDINVCDGSNGFYVYNMTVKEEFAKIIDNYFSMFGYKTNRLKIPNITGRQNWNYVKTIGCDFDAKNSSKMSREDEIKIQQMFDNGVTLWHNPNTMYDYSQSNNIV